MATYVPEILCEPKAASGKERKQQADMFRRRDQLTLTPVLGVIAALFFLVALIDRPQALPPEAAQYGSVAPLAVKQQPEPAITSAVDTIEADGKQRAIADPAPITTSGPITIHGWAVDPDTLAPAKRLLVSLDGSRAVAAGTYGVPRPDVAAVVGPAAAKSGFAVVLSTAGMRPGTHTLRLSLEDANGKHTLLPAIVRFELRKP